MPWIPHPHRCRVYLVPPCQSVRTDGRTLTSWPNFLSWIGFPFSINYGAPHARFTCAEALLKCLQNILDSWSCQKETSYFLILSRSDITTVFACEYSRFSVMASLNVSSSHLSRMALAMGSNEGRLYSLAMKLLTILPTNYNFFQSFSHYWYRNLHISCFI